MPRRYTRKVGIAPRATWSEEALKQAVSEVESKAMSINAASKQFGVPSRTLRRRMLKKDYIKRGLGKIPALGYDVEKKLVLHIKKLEKAGFPCTRTDVRKLAFQLAQQLNIKHNFNVGSEMAGKQWLQSFLERHETLSVRQAEGMSRARALGFTREEIESFFKLYEETLSQHDLFDKPGHIFNMDETGVQMNNKPGKVIATKGSKLVQHITSGEKGETISIVTCNNAEGVFLPPVLILKGVNKKPEFLDGLPPGSNVYMSKKSAYINSELFMKWLVEHFIPRKPQGKVVLLLDGHGSHCNDINMLETAALHDIILLGLPSHTTHGLQPLDRSFFKPFKTFYATELRQWIVANKERKITRYQAGRLIGAAWIRATSTVNALSGFKACGIFPYNPNAIPDHYYTVADASQYSTENAVTTNMSENNLTTPTENADTLPIKENLLVPMNSPPSTSTSEPMFGSNTVEKASSTRQATEKIPIVIECSPSTSKSKSVLLDISPTQQLLQLSPIPIVAKVPSKRKRQVAQLLNSPTVINEKKKKIEEALHKSQEKENKKINKTNKGKTSKGKEIVKPTTLQNVTNRKENYKKKEKKKKNIDIHSSSSESEESELSHTSDELNEQCRECLEIYGTTKSTADWIRCISCEKWLHENCTLYGDFCNKCGRAEKIKNIRK